MSKTKSAVVLVRWRNKILLLQRREDDRSYPGGVFCFPGGKLDEGETSLDAAIRELAEETCFEMCPQPDEEDAVENDRFEIAVFRTWVLSDANEENRPPRVEISDEHQGYVWVDPTTINASTTPYAGEVTRGLMIREKDYEWLRRALGEEEKEEDLLGNG